MKMTFEALFLTYCFSCFFFFIHRLLPLSKFMVATQSRVAEQSACMPFVWSQLAQLNMTSAFSQLRIKAIQTRKHILRTKEIH